MFPSNRQKLKKRKCDLHEISSTLPKGAFTAVYSTFFFQRDLCLFY